MRCGAKLSAAMLAAVLLVTACGVISRQARDQVNFTGSFTELQKDLDAHQGATVLWGGSVIGARARGDATEIEILQLALDVGQRPTREELSQGRFLVIVPMPFDPLRFPRETSLTVVGRVIGREVRPIDEMLYAYPLLESIEFKSWYPEKTPTYIRPRFTFGVGIGTRF